MISVADLIRYRLRHERFVSRQAEGCIHTDFGSFRTISYRSAIHPESHLVLLRGEIGDGNDVLVRMHSHCVYGDIFGSVHCDCRRMIHGAMERIAEEDRGVIVYLHQTGPGMRLGTSDGCQSKIETHGRDFQHYAGEDRPKMQHEAGIGAQILADLGLHTIRLLTNHRRKVPGLDAYGIEIVGHIPVKL